MKNNTDKPTTNWSLFTIKINRALTSGNEALAKEALQLVEKEKLNEMQDKMIKLITKAIKDQTFKFGQVFRGTLFNTWKKLEKLEAFKIVDFEVPEAKFASQSFKVY